MSPCVVVAPGVVACTRGPVPRTRECQAQLPDGRPCGASAPLLCDGQKPGGGTCDLPICRKHAQHVGRDRDLCPACAETHKPQLPLDPATMPKRLKRPDDA